MLTQNALNTSHAQVLTADEDVLLDAIVEAPLSSTYKQAIRMVCLPYGKQYVRLRAGACKSSCGLWLLHSVGQEWCAREQA